MTRWLRWTLCWTVTLLLCGVGTVLAPAPRASADPPSAGVGRVVADLGVVIPVEGRSGFSFDGRYYSYLVPVDDDGCVVHVYDVQEQAQVPLTHAANSCFQATWAAHTDTLWWQVGTSQPDLTAWAWDAGSAQVTQLATDAKVQVARDLSADGRYLAFAGSSDSHPSPAPGDYGLNWYVYDRTTGVSLPLSRADQPVTFRSWAPLGDHFVTAIHVNATGRIGYCFGSGSSCRTFGSGSLDWSWSGDGTALIGRPGTTVYDFSNDALTPLPKVGGNVSYAYFLGTDAERVFAETKVGGVIWDRRTGSVHTIASPATPRPSPDGKVVLYQDTAPDAYRFYDVTTGRSAQATFRGAHDFPPASGYWTADSASYVGTGPGGCTSLRQWSPTTNTVSLFGPPTGPHSCYFADPPDGSASSASGRFANVYETHPHQLDLGYPYLVDLRRHVLTRFTGKPLTWAPAGADVLVVGQDDTGITERVLLVDPTPVPDTDDQPRWSAATPANGSTFRVVAGQRGRLQIGASDLQGTPVNLYFRWRTAAGVPVKSAAVGWTCDRQRLAAGATQATCTYAPTSAGDEVRYVDVWAVNYVTGAQSDTRSYQVGPRT
ncbi:MAG TPA: hypothetical protein VGC37_03720 [Friedmanniella sp.]